jgi:hypothetical protein
MESVGSFCAEVEQTDDITILALGFKEGRPSHSGSRSNNS